MLRPFRHQRGWWDVPFPRLRHPILTVLCVFSSLEWKNRNSSKSSNIKNLKLCNVTVSKFHDNTEVYFWKCPQCCNHCGNLELFLRWYVRNLPRLDFCGLFFKANCPTRVQPQCRGDMTYIHTNNEHKLLNSDHLFVDHWLIRWKYCLGWGSNMAKYYTCSVCFT